MACRTEDWFSVFVFTMGNLTSVTTQTLDSIRYSLLHLYLTHQRKLIGEEAPHCGQLLYMLKLINIYAHKGYDLELS